MKYEKRLEDFATKYNLSYKKQIFYNYLNLGYVLKMYSLFNQSGCFTISQLLPRDDINFFFSQKFSKNPEELQEKITNIFEIHKEVWKTKSKFLIFPIPLFYSRIGKVVNTLVDIMEIDAFDKKEVFGLKIYDLI